MDSPSDRGRQAYALIRLDDHGEWTLQMAPALISVLKVLPTREEAEAEADALNADWRADAEGAVHYVVLPTWVY
jgi:hypothetical protein